jgi:hypothetical protein
MGRRHVCASSVRTAGRPRTGGPACRRRPRLWPVVRSPCLLRSRLFGRARAVSVSARPRLATSSGSGGRVITYQPPAPAATTIATPKTTIPRPRRFPGAAFAVARAVAALMELPRWRRPLRRRPSGPCTHWDLRLTTEVYGHLAPGYLRSEIDRLQLAPPAPESPRVAVAIATTPAFATDLLQTSPFQASAGSVATVELTDIATKNSVGARGFEPPTFCSQSRRATRLRHAPWRRYLTQRAGHEHARRLNFRCI